MNINNEINTATQLDIIDSELFPFSNKVIKSNNRLNAINKNPIEIRIHEILNLVLRIRLTARKVAPNCNKTDTISAMLIAILQNCES